MSGIKHVDMVVVSDTLNIAFRDAVETVRLILGDMDIGNFRLEVVASGRTMTDRNEVKIELRLSDTYYGDNTVKGAKLDKVIEEFGRRNGWNKANAPLALAAPDSEG